MVLPINSVKKLPNQAIAVGCKSEAPLFPFVKDFHRSDDAHEGKQDADNFTKHLRSSLHRFDVQKKEG